MGKHEEWRDFMKCLFPKCFQEKMPIGAEFDMCIVDMMQFLARMRSETTFRPREVSDHIVRAAFDYSNIDEREDRPVIKKAMVFLFDTAKNVPKCKATTQISRDTSGQDGENDESSTIMTKELYDALLEEMSLQPGEYMIHNDMKKVPAKMTPTTVWRSNSLKWQLNSMVVTALLKNLVVPRGKVVVIDDGVVFGDPYAYRRLRDQIINEYHFEEKSDYEKEVLVSFLITHTLTMRYVLHHDGQFKRMPESGIGEADVKFGNYIMRESEGKRNPIRRYLIVSQDTDIPFILLAHMKRMIDPETGKVDNDLEIWVDTQTPTDKGRGITRDYRFVNIKGLYHAIIALFKEEYPTVENPIETFLFMVNMLATDFTNRLGDKYLGITRLVVWNTFSETHSQSKDGYIVFSRQKKDRSKVVHFPVNAYQLLSGDAIKVVYNEETLEHRIILDMVQCEKFLYLLCQQAFVKDMIKLKAIQSKTYYYADHDNLLVHVKDLMLSIAAHKAKQIEEENQSTATLLGGKSFIVPQQSTQTKNVSSSSSKKTGSIGPAVSFTPTDTQRFYDKSVLATLCTKAIPEMYSIPTRTQMKARICRLDWVLNYIQNGTVSKHASTSYDASLPFDKDQSLYGWQSVPLDIEGNNLVNLNSSYHTQSLTQVLLGQMPIRAHATKECDDF